MTGRGAWNRLFDETLSSLRFTVDGDDLALEATLNLLQDPDREKRRKAAAALANVFSENLRTFTLITNTLAKDKEISDRWRGFADVADSRHLANRVEREVVDALSLAVTDAYPAISHRYYAMKAKWLGLDVLDYWDRNAPLPDSSRRDISWDEARSTVLSAYSGFAPEMATIAERFFVNNWIDAAIRPGKSPGAFAHPTVPGVHPYVLLNYMGKPRDVMTLAHELGHGVHQVLAGRQGALMAATPLTLAETASVFGEMLTFRSLLDQAKTKAERKTLLASKVEDMINTVVRQIAFYQFERALHEERRQGELTSERIGEMWVDVQGRSLGPCDPSWRRLRDVLDLRPALHPLALLRLRLCVRRLPGELALRGLRELRERLPGEVLRDAEGRRHQAPFGAPEAVRPRRLGPGLLVEGPRDDLRLHRRAGSDGLSIRLRWIAPDAGASPRDRRRSHRSCDGRTRPRVVRACSQFCRVAFGTRSRAAKSRWLILSRARVACNFSATWSGSTAWSLQSGLSSNFV